MLELSIIPQVRISHANSVKLSSEVHNFHFRNRVRVFNFVRRILDFEILVL